MSSEGRLDIAFEVCIGGRLELADPWEKQLSLNPNDGDREVTHDSYALKNNEEHGLGSNPNGKNSDGGPYAQEPGSNPVRYEFENGLGSKRFRDQRVMNQSTFQISRSLVFFWESNPPSTDQ